MMKNINRQMDGWTHGWTQGQTDQLTNQRDRQTDRQTDREYKLISMEPCYSTTLCYNSLYILFRFLNKKKIFKVY